MHPGASVPNPQTPNEGACSPLPRASSQRMPMLPRKMRHSASAGHLALNLEMTQKARWGGGGGRRKNHPLLSGKLQGATRHGVPADAGLSSPLNLKHLQVQSESPSMRHLLSTCARCWAYKVNTKSSLLS